uniref:Peptide-N(4)-(N-acetyl-beta-glucosaminyl)asparagine amidase n=1 Tax=Setaria digitata TaxID=48799 RepID=A0A915PZZ3_9BILA
MVVRELPDDSTFSQFVAEAGMKLVVIDFYAQWCGPCRMVAPHVGMLSDKYLQVVFIKVNVETCRQTSARFKINAMPTFVLLYNDSEVDRVIGANIELLETKIVQQLKKSLTATSDERIFLEKFLKYSERMQIYEDEVSQALARSLMPCDKLMEASKVDGKLNKLELIKLLLNWFKTDFFTWTDIPKCELCGQNAKKSEEIQASPTEEEKKLGAYRVEVFKCQACDTDVRFPRYNDPVKLLETRCGRCGEWANCFTLFARALGLETRWVYDVTDHVWCEIWLEDLDRWVHCDPCENIIDTPLLYEKKLNIRYEKLMSEERRKELERRYMKELVEFISPNMQIREGSKIEERGRITGSEEWKRRRGEGGSEKLTERVLVPTSKEISSKVFSLEYNCAKDQYKRGVDVIKGWESLVSKQENVLRVVDQTNNVAYICRQNGKSNGELWWSFDFGNNHVKNIEFRLDGVKKDNDVTVEALQDMTKAVICCGDICTIVPSTGELELETIESSKIDVKVYFSDGRTQLFLSNLHSGDHVSFRVKAFFS